MFNIVSKSTLLFGSTDSMFKISCLIPYDIDIQNFVICNLDGRVYNWRKYYFSSFGSKNNFIYWGKFCAVYWNGGESLWMWVELLLLELIIFWVCDFDYDGFFFLSYFFYFLEGVILSSYTQAKKFNNDIPETNTFDFSLLFPI